MTAIAVSGPRVEFVDDILDIAAGGGINYWAEIVEHTSGRLVVRDRFEGDTGEVTLATVAGTIGDLHNGDVRITPALQATIVAAWKAASASNIDAEAADALVQLSVFGTIQYG